MEGWIKIHQKIVDWEWFDIPEMVALWIHILLSANWQDQEWRGMIIPRGSFVTSIAKLAKETGLSIKQTRTCLNRLKSTNEAAIKTTNKYSIVTVCKYDIYQLIEDDEGQAAGQSRGKQKGKQIGNQGAGINTCGSYCYEDTVFEQGNQGASKRATTKEYNNTGSSIVSSSSVDKSTPEESTISEPRPTTMSDAANAEDVLTSRHCQNVADFWNKTVLETKSTLPQIRALSEERKKKIRVRWKEFSTVGDPVEVCKVVFRNVCTSFFCQGGGKSGWTASFDWVFSNGQNWIKAYEGEYDNKPIPRARQQAAPKTRLEQMEDNMRFINEFFDGQQSNTTPDEQ